MVAALHSMLRVAEMFIHFDLEASFENLFRRPSEHAASAHKIDAISSCLSDQLLSERPVNPATIPLIGTCNHDHMMVCHCLSFRLNHDDSACQARPPRI